MINERIEIIGVISHACDSGARQAKACEIIGISAKTFQRWSQSEHQMNTMNTGQAHFTIHDSFSSFSIASEYSPPAISFLTF